MKKIILYLGILFTYYVSIRFINSSINQDDFNYVNNQKDIVTIFAFLIVIAILIYHFYQAKTKTQYQLKIENFCTQKNNLEKEQHIINDKLKLISQFNKSLNTKVSIIKNDLLEVEKDLPKNRLNQLKESINILDHILNYCKLP
ncbi:hypothetical protein [Aurantibacter aestuarii]|uniref:Uncharacterized protein n=1 Tax=Aurantibacter aestuarii TaxID=1266046 RepID=A0A2T1NC36_9FLAO|nr:hypothetical protein [Aurantibacter aestuarii]PSG90002.1 hypothetical protein C7H52_01655 [Aurantibacter aestuarii]